MSMKDDAGRLEEMLTTASDEEVTEFLEALGFERFWRCISWQERERLKPLIRPELIAAYERKYPTMH